MRAQFELDVDGTLTLYPSIGRADSDASVTIYDASGAVIDPASVVTLGAASQALTADVSRSADLITVADASAFKIGRPYWLTNEEGSGIEVKLRGKTATTLRLDQPLPWAAVQTDSLIRDHALSYDLAAAVKDTLRRRNKARFVYLVDGVEYRESVLFDVVAEPFSILASEEQIETVEASFGERRGAREGWRKTMHGAQERLFDDLEAQGITPELIYGHSLLRRALIYQTLAVFYRLNTERRELFEAQYADALAAIVAAGQWPAKQGAV